jgi:hypothetical protein
MTPVVTSYPPPRYLAGPGSAAGRSAVAGAGPQSGGPLLVRCVVHGLDPGGGVAAVGQVLKQEVQQPIQQRGACDHGFKRMSTDAAPL